MFYNRKIDVGTRTVDRTAHVFKHTSLDLAIAMYRGQDDGSWFSNVAAI